jgi:hypothetical protein
MRLLWHIITFARDLSISPKRFVEIFHMFEEERQKLYDFQWEKEIPFDEPDM